MSHRVLKVLCKFRIDIQNTYTHAKFHIVDTYISFFNNRLFVVRANSISSTRRCLRDDNIFTRCKNVVDFIQQHLSLIRSRPSSSFHTARISPLLLNPPEQNINPHNRRCKLSAEPKDRPDALSSAATFPRRL